MSTTPKPIVLCWPRMPFAREETIALLRGEPRIELRVVHEPAEVIADLPHADALVLHSAPVATARPVVNALGSPGRRLRWMHFLTAGRDGFEAAGLQRDIAVTHVTGASAPVVAEHALALLLGLARRLPSAVRQGDDRIWERSTLGPFVSLEGTRVAVLGTGAIGTEIARRLLAFGATAVGISRLGAAQPGFSETHPVSGLRSVLHDCRALVVAVPLTEATRRLVDAPTLACLPAGALVVNVARGAVVDQAALCDALAEGRLGGAALDVTDPEPPAADDRIWSLDNLLLTPHVATEGSPATAMRIAQGTLDNVQRFVDGRELLNLAER